jgi:hypothetical protein
MILDSVEVIRLDHQSGFNACRAHFTALISCNPIASLVGRLLTGAYGIFNVGQIFCNGLPVIPYMPKFSQ